MSAADAHLLVSALTCGSVIGLLVTVTFLALRIGDISENLRRIEMALVLAARGDLTNKKNGPASGSYPAIFQDIVTPSPDVVSSGDMPAGER